MPNAKVKLYVAYVGRINLPNKAFMTPGIDINVPISMPAYCYLIEHTKGLALVDTGMLNGGPAVVSEDEIICCQLAKLGYAPDDVKYVIMTHLHIDHAGYMSAFPKATFIARNEELRAAWWPEKSEGGYVFDLYKDTRYFDFIQPEDDEIYDVFLDGSVVLFDTKGHTRGHQSVIVKLEKEGFIVLAADAASLREHLDGMILPGSCSNNWSAIRTLERLRHLEKEGHTIFFGHDIEQGKTLKLLPQYYE